MRPILPACLGTAIIAGMGALLADVPEPKDTEYYRVILDRNPFGLHEAPQIAPEPSNPPPVKVDVKFTGITAHSGSKKAWFMIPAVGGKTANPKYLSMMEGEKDGDLQVLEINEKEATVKVLNAGVPVVLNFRENGLAAPTTLAVPGPSAAPVPGIKAPGANPAIAPAGGVASYSPTPAAAVVPAAGQPSGEAGSGIRTIPARSLRTTPAPAATDASAAQPAVDPAVQYIQLKAQEQAAKLQGLKYPPLPPPISE